MTKGGNAMKMEDTEKKLVCEFKDKAREVGLPLQEYVSIRLVDILSQVNDALCAVSDELFEELLRRGR